MNIQQLIKNTKDLAGWRVEGYGQNANFTLTNILPMVGTKMLLFQSKCRGETVEAEHVQNLQYNQIKYHEEVPEEFENIKTVEFRKEQYHYEKPDETNNVQIRCSCADFTYRSAYYAWKEKCLFGTKPKLYKRKTKTRPPANKLKIPILCKHLVQLTNYLQNEDYIQ